MAFHWSLSDSRSSQVARTLLSILVDLNNVILIVSPPTLISMSFSPCTNLLVTVPRAPIMIGIDVTFMQHNFVRSPAKYKYLYLSSLSFFNFSLFSDGTTKSTIRQVFFLLTITRSGRLAEIRLSVCILKSQRSLCVLFFRVDSGLYKYHLFVLLLLLHFDLRPGQTCHSKVMNRKEVTHSNGSYERKSRRQAWQTKWDKVNKSHGTLIDWCTGREWPVNCMTVISAWWRSNIPFQRLSGRLSGRWTII